MKNVIFISILCLASGCYRISHSFFADFDIEAIAQTNLKTYAIVWNDSLYDKTNKLIKGVIAKKLNGLGYRESIEKVDLLVHYAIYDKPLKTIILSDPTYQSFGRKATKDRKIVNLANGSIYITFYNEENNRMIWRGYSKGYNSDPKAILEDAHHIIDQYNLFATTNLSKKSDF